MIVKLAAEAKLFICSLQEVRYRNSGKKVINLTLCDSLVFYWCDMKGRRCGNLDRQCKDSIMMTQTQWMLV